MRRSTRGSPARKKDGYAALDQLLNTEFADVADMKVTEVDPARLESLLRIMIKGMLQYVEPDMYEIVGLRFVMGFLDHILHEGMGNIFHTLDGLMEVVYEAHGAEPELYDMKKVLSKKSKNADRLRASFKRAFEVASKHAKIQKRQADDEYDVDFEMPGDCIYSAVYDKLIAPADEFLYEIYELTSGTDGLYYGSVFNELQYLAEDVGILSMDLRTAAFSLGTHLGLYFFVRPDYIPDQDRITEVRKTMTDFARGMKAFDPEEVEIPEGLSDVDKEVFADLMKAVAPLARAVHKPILKLAKMLKQGDDEGVCDFFTDYTVDLLGNSLEEVIALVRMIREGARMKADVIERLSQAARDGRGEDVMVALFTKMAHHAMEEGYRLDDFMMFAGMLLDQVDHDISPDAYGSGDFYAPKAFAFKK